jgi:hypothetical protein
MRNTLINDLVDQCGKRNNIESGIVGIMFTQNRVQHLTDETSFLAYYQVSRSTVKLIGLHPSRDLFSLSSFWFRNNHKGVNEPVRYKKHELAVKAQCLKMTAAVQKVVRDEFSYSDIDLEEMVQISIHKDFFFMVKNDKNEAQPRLGKSFTSLRERPLTLQDLIQDL